MILPVAVARGVAAGEVDRVYRRWARPRVRAGSTLRTAAGVVEIVAVEQVDPATLTDDDARAAGAASAAEVLRSFRRSRSTSSPGAAPRAPGAATGDGVRDEDPVWRIRLRAAGADPRIALRESVDGLDATAARLDRLDRASRHGPWTRATLRLVAAHPGERAAALAARAGRERDPFKLDVRKLKDLGLTESLEIGYRISPRGAAFLESGA
ncbi:hypothetical protein AD006_04000 [Pseudonocardia sp. EC080610-09]|uniref:hypothetical protein n=1 Tax=unclassified Pseudonocardia TaxID=2619320 RepID=UPI0006CB25B4|nr:MULTISPECIES: hypothetical protein [unclassified Pseudonocardia]ALE75329.1 hypothetical protein FRP1_24815 [Pseudonocardia sp. EC080625-04]ALL74691.1 hypothetical protein AD006_04000 [Pseudonocardia sp. EC080610-09]ALL81713.1 hypothetical protein AD017_11820 [Pseudonocardia sp. EC080619-01]